MRENNKRNHKICIRQLELSVSFIDMNNRKIILLPGLLLSIVILAASPLPGWSQLGSSSSNEPTIVDANSNLAIEEYAGGMEFPSSMAFLGPDDILVLEKNTGQVRKIVNGAMLEQLLIIYHTVIHNARVI